MAKICRKAGISQAKYFNWKKQYGGLLPDEMHRLTCLEEENARLKKIVAQVASAPFLSPDAIERQEAATTRRLDQIDRKIARLERDVGIKATSAVCKAWTKSTPRMF